MGSDEEGMIFGARQMSEKAVVEHKSVDDSLLLPSLHTQFD